MCEPMYSHLSMRENTCLSDNNVLALRADCVFFFRFEVALLTNMLYFRKKLTFRVNLHGVAFFFGEMHKDVR